MDKGGSEHLLHLYATKQDKYSILKNFLISSNSHDSTIIVTSDDITLTDEFSSIKTDIQICNPNNIFILGKKLKSGLFTKLVIDFTTFSSQSQFNILKQEGYIKKIINKYELKCLCLYKLGDVSSEILEYLTSIHTEYKLTARDLTIVSGKSIIQSTVSSSLKKIAKDNLEAIILALINRNAMCGTDLIKAVYVEFEILLSPGTIYPILHSLYEKDLVTWVKEGKEKKYRYVQNSENKVKKIIKDYVNAQSLLATYLYKELDLEKEMELINVVKED